MKNKKLLTIIAMLLLVCTLAFVACSEEPKKADDEEREEEEEEEEESEEESTKDSQASVKKTVIPEIPEELIKVIEEMGFEIHVEKFENAEDAQMMAEAMNISTDAFEDLTLIGFGISSNNEGPDEYLNFYYCSNLKRALEIKSVFGDDYEEWGYMLEQEGNIIAYGSRTLWDAFVDFTSK